MVMFASQIQQQLYQSQLAMAQQSQQAQLLSQQMGINPESGMVPQVPMMPQMNIMSGATPGMAGIYGEQVSNRLINGARTGLAVGGLGLGLVGGMSSIPLDPFSAAYTGAKWGWKGGGVSGAIAGGAAMALPYWMAGEAIGAYTGAFQGGMREQAQTNSMLRNNFNFAGGQGAYGRGFSQGQMGTIGSMITQETQRTPYTSSQELNSLIGQGADTGLFTAVRDVETFGKRFRSMLDGLRKIQKELGGTLSEAMQLTRGSMQLGIYTNEGRQQLAGQLRDTMATTGMDMNQAFNLAATGAMLSRATGGFGRQGAQGALKAARTIGTAIQSGVLSQEMLSDATGGLQGEEAVQAFAARQLQSVDRFTRTAAGRYSMFALANAEGTGIDQTMLARFRAGEISVPEMMTAAHKNVNSMGRAKALNMEGILRGAMMEDPMVAEANIARKMLGDKGLDVNDDLASLVIQRRLGKSRPEAEMLMSFMANQSTMAANEEVETTMGKRQVELQRDRANQGIDRFMADFEHGMQDKFGILGAREMGRQFLTRVSGSIEKTMNAFLGIEADALEMEEKQALTRLGMGQGTKQDKDRLSFMWKGGDQFGTGSFGDPFQRSASMDILERFGLHSTTKTMGETFKARGIDLAPMSVEQRYDELRRREMAIRGELTKDEDKQGYNYLLGFTDHGANDVVGTTTTKQFGMAPEQQKLMGVNRERVVSDNILKMMRADMYGGTDRVYEDFRGLASAGAVDAFASKTGYNLKQDDMRAAARGGDRLSQAARATSGVIDSAIDYGGAGAALGMTVGSVAGPWGMGILGTLGGVGGAAYGAYKAIGESAWTQQESALQFIKRGGHAGNWADKLIDRAAVTGDRAAVGEDGELREVGDLLTRRSGGDLRDERYFKRGSMEGAITPMTTGEGREYREFLDKEKLSIEDVKSVMDSPGIKETLRKMEDMKDPQQRKVELGNLAIRASKMEGKQGSALKSMIRQIEFNYETQGKMGDEFRVGRDDLEKMLQGRSELGAIGAQYKAGMEFMPEGDIKEAFGKLTSDFFGAASGQQSVEDPFAQVDDVVKKMANMGEEERRQYAKAFGSNDYMKGLLNSAERRKGLVKSMTGDTNRGRAGAADAIFGMVSGNSIAQMDFTIDGQKVQGRNKSQVLYEAFAKGGARADDLEKQLIKQLEESGVEKAADYVGNIRNRIQGGKVDDKEANDTIDMLKDDESIKKIQKDAMLAAQSARDPLGVQRNELLTNIKTAVETLVKMDPNTGLPRETGTK